ncbi:MAG: oligoendopeptidase F [Acidobacteria bacterium]|nr:oligoendopeptidase F [Acidobacteriota bacterium]
MTGKQKKRDELPAELTWDLTPLYSSDAAWEQAFQVFAGREEKVLVLKGRLGSSAENLAAAFRWSDEIEREVSKLYVYAHLRSDEDTTNTRYMGMQDRVRSRMVQVGAALAWIEPEIMAIDEATIERFRHEDVMAPYRWALTLVLRKKPHTLSESEERLLSMAAEPLGTPAKTFSLLNNADLRFPEISDEQGQPVELTHGNYIKFLENRDRSVRQHAFLTLYETYGRVKNTLASLLDGNVKKHVFHARVRRHGSALQAALFDDHIDQQVYDNLIATVHDYLPDFYRYVDLRCRMLGLDKPDMFDMYVPIVPEVHFEVEYEEACRWVTEALRPLGDEYGAVVRRVFTERWIDVLECRGKRSGAYSSGCYDSKPYILLNYQGTLDHVFTLAHEMGHSLHSYFSDEAQPHIYAQYSIVAAEVASTTNEALLHHYLMEKFTDPHRKAYLLNHLCDGFKGTVFRQTMFAEFEKMIHDKAEHGIPLTPDELSESYYQLNSRYYGPAVDAHRHIALEWARIPHFYYNFYVYKYATGFAAAQALAAGILDGSSENVDRYLSFLRAGGSRFPLDILAQAGVDLRDSQPVRAALEIFRQTVAELGAALGA